MPRNPLWDDLGQQGPHPGYMGGMLEAQPVLLRESNIVGFVTNVRAYPEGLMFHVVLEQALDDGTLTRSGPLEAKPSVRVSVEFADGSRWQADEHGGSESLIELEQDRSSGEGGASWFAGYWLPALPPSGPVTFLVDLGDRRGQGRIQGDDIREAARKATDLWS